MHRTDRSQLENIASIVYCVAILFAKLSILLLFDKLLIPAKNGLYYWINTTLMWFFCLFYAVAIAVLLGQCNPRAKIWIPSLPGYCVNIGAACVLSAITNTLTNLVVLIFPIWIIWHLQMPLKRKAGVIFVFATGLLCVSIRVLMFKKYAD